MNLHSNRQWILAGSLLNLEWDRSDGPLSPGGLRQEEGNEAISCSVYCGDRLTICARALTHTIGEPASGAH